MSTDHLDEFNDLDDYLEDPRNLDHEQLTKIDNDQQNSNNEDFGSLCGLQEQFASLMSENNDNSEINSIENFKMLLGILDAAGKPSKPNTDVSDNNSPKFKDIVSNTLDRLKENSNKIDTKLKEEKKSRNSDGILSQLLDQLVEGDDENGEGLDNAILNILNQMSSKEILYQPMKDMQLEFNNWMKQNETNKDFENKITTYKEQQQLVDEIIIIYEKDDYTNEKYRKHITELLDKLEALGESPVNKGFSDELQAKGINDLSKVLEINGDENLDDLDKELQDSCTHQ